MGRRRFVAGASAALGLGLASRPARAEEPESLPVAPELAPVLYVSHGGPDLATSDVRGRELRAWGSTIGPARGIVSITPHYRARGLELGAIGAGRGARSFPRRFASALRGIDYRTPDNGALAARVEELLGEVGEVRRSERRANDHTTWMPLLHLFPDADVPVVEVALPFASDREVWDLGRALGALRREGVVLHCSGQMTHNLAMLGRRGPPVPWALAFDEWARGRVNARDWDALRRWRRAAPDPYLAHPDDGGHFDVLLVALGAVEATALSHVTHPVGGFELGALSKSCIDLR